MKIALIRKEFDTARGGAERYAVNLARGLTDAGHDVHVFAGTWQKQCCPGITMHRVPFIKRPSPLKNLSFQRNSRGLVVRESFDIVQGLSQVFPGDVYRVGEPLHIHWLYLNCRNPLKRLLKYLSPRHMAILAIERAIFKPGSYRRIIVNSAMSKKQVMHYYGVPEARIRIVYNGVDPEQFNADDRDRRRREVRTRYSLPEDDMVLLFAGHDFKRKGLQFALQYALALRGQGLSVRLIVAGRGDQAAYARLAQQQRFADRMVFLGPVADMRDLYHCADLLVHPALYEPFGNVCLEAMACGLPVATTRLNGASELLDDGATGIIADAPWDTAAMIAGITRALEHNAAGLKDMGKRAAVRAREFTIDRHVAEMLAVYRDVLARKGMQP